ncbi:MAG: PQQ-dependent sugar dehydrogenase [Planctomycetota bacterium]
MTPTTATSTSPWATAAGPTTPTTPGKTSRRPTRLTCASTRCKTARRRSNCQPRPTPNPFAVNSDLDDSRNLIYLYGVRNAHRFSWDTDTARMFLYDIGQGVIEEINEGFRGANYGWDDREGAYTAAGSSNVTPLPPGHPTDAFTYPVAQYDHEGNGLTGNGAVAGGHVYRGSAVPQLTGLMVFGDFSNNQGPIFAVDVDDLVARDDLTNLNTFDDGRLAPYRQVGLRLAGDAADSSLLDLINDARVSDGEGTFFRTDLRFGIGPDGELYVLNKRDGRVRKVVGVVGVPDGDFNRDGVVDLLDFDILAQNFGGPGDWGDGNANNDGIIDLLDFDVLAQNFGAPGNTQVAAGTVPEPGAVLTLAAGLALARRRRR